MEGDSRRDDPAALWLCQLPGLSGELLLRLLERWGSAGAVLGAPSSALREAGLPPALVARFVAAPRELPRVVESLRALERLGIRAVPIAVHEYPQRLRQLDRPPPVLYVQGRWPLPGPLVLLLGEPEPGAAERWAELAAGLDAEILIGASEARAAVDVGLVALASGVLRVGNRLPRAVLERVSGGHTTLLSASPPGAQASAEAAQASLAAMAALADATVCFAGAPPAAGVGAVFAWEQSSVETGGIRRLRRGRAGLRQLRAALGIRLAGDARVHQERLF